MKWKAKEVEKASNDFDRLAVFLALQTVQGPAPFVEGLEAYEASPLKDILQLVLFLSYGVSLHRHIW